MLSREQIEDAQALRRLLNDKPMYQAVERLVRRMNDDIVRRWSEDETVKRQYVRGAREVLAAFLENLAETAVQLREHEEQEQDMAAATRSVAGDGLGSGDLAS